MTEAHNKGLLSMTEKQLRKKYEQGLEHVHFSPQNYYDEIVRRTQERHSTAIRWLAGITAISAVIATIATVFTLAPKF